MRWKSPPLLNFAIATFMVIGLLAIDTKQQQYPLSDTQQEHIAEACNGWFPGRGILRGIQAMRYNRAQRVASRMQQYEQPSYGVQRVGYYSSQPASYGSGGSQQYQVSYYVPNTSATYSVATPSYGSAGGGGNDSSVVIEESYDYPQGETVIEETIVEEPAAEPVTQPTAEQPKADTFWQNMQQENPAISEQAKELIRAVIEADRKLQSERPKLERELLKSPLEDETASTANAKPQAAKTVVRKTIRRVQPQSRVMTQAPPVWIDPIPPSTSNRCPGGVCPIQPTYRF